MPLVNVRNERRNHAGHRKVKDLRPVEDYLRVQKRFKHLFIMEDGEEEIKKIQTMANWNIKHYWTSVKTMFYFCFDFVL